MSQRLSARRSLVALVIGVLVGGGLLAVTPAGATLSNAAASNWKKIWKKNLRPQADKRYYPKRVSNNRYASKSALEDFYTRAAADARYAAAGSSYTKADADARYAAAGSSYTKAEIDAKLAPLVNSVAVTAGGQQDLALTVPDQVVRSVSLLPPADGTVIVSSSATMEVIANGTSRCSITQDTEIDFGALQLVRNGLADTAYPIAGTRGFAVTKGNLLTVNLVCDEFTGSAELSDSHLTAIFAPS